jgi:NADH-quinone oxidoreductase subunit L
VTAGLTAFYTFRLLFVAFYGKSRRDKKADAHIHESPPVMVVPLVILAVLAALAGYIGLPGVFGLPNAIDEFLSPVFADVPISEPVSGAAAGELGVMLVSALVMGLASGRRWIYVRKWGRAERMTRAPGGCDLCNKYYVDKATWDR